MKKNINTPKHLFVVLVSESKAQSKVGKIRLFFFFLSVRFGPILNLAYKTLKFLDY